jgi:TolA-binding protein
MKGIRIDLRFFILILLFWYANVAAGGVKEKLGIGFNVNTQKLYGDTRNGQFVYGFNPIQLRYNIKPRVYLESEVGIGQLSNRFTGVTRSTDLLNLGMKAGYRFRRWDKVNPLVYLGIGVLNFNLGTGSRFWDGYGAVGVGTEVFFGDRLGINFTGDYRYTTGDDFDGRNTGNHKDGFLNLGMGLFYYFGSRTNFDSEPEMSDAASEDLLPYEEVSDDNSEVAGMSDAPIFDSDFLASQKEELLKAKDEREKTIKILKIKLASWDMQLEKLEEELQNRKLFSLSNSTARALQENDNVMQLYRKGLSLYEAEYYQDAIRIFKNLLTENPDHVIATNFWYWLGESYFSAQDYGLAIEAFQKVIEDLNSSKNAISHFMLALSQWKMGNISQAKSEFEEILELYPNSLYEPLVRDYLAEL